MSEKNTGGPAFPSDWYPDDGRPSQGMTLRDYFAAKAMVGLMQMVSTGAHGLSATDPAGDLSRQAYEAADAMLKAREA